MSLPRTTADLHVEPEPQSESGSEDGWNGEPPENMDGMDVFKMAAAGGRQGKDFEERTEEWRSKGEVPGGRRESARRSLQVGCMLGFC